MSHSFSGGVSRRRFVQGLAVGGVAAAFGWPRSSLAASATPVLTGTDFDLVIDELPVNFTGRTRIGVAVNGPDADTPERLLRSADTKLYQAKAAGRNKVVC